MASFKDKLLVPPHVKEFHPTPSTTTRFAHEGFNIDIIMEDTTMGEVLGLLELMQGKSTPSCQQVLKPSLWHFKG
jgi:hypothetical protein